MDTRRKMPFQPAPLRLGTIVVDPPLILAPMAGVTDQDYRALMARHGAGMVSTEMVSAQGIVKDHPETWKLCAQHPPLPVPLAVQLFGSSPSVMAQAAAQVAQSGARVIDINAGCPVKKVVKQGAGASLLKDPERLASMVEEIKAAVSLPVTVKTRLGWDSGSREIVRIAEMLARAGADALSIHARTAAQKYSGKADWTWIRRVKAEVGIPVIGNGDVTGPVSAERMLEETACDAVMVGRATQGNPWLISAIASRWGQVVGVPQRPDWNDYLETVSAHVEAFIRRKPRAIGHCRMLLIWYSKGCPEASRFRSRLAAMERPDGMLSFFRDWVSDFREKGIPFLETKVPEVDGRAEDNGHTKERGQ